MAIDPYAPCMCGSGKKVKFCCADIQADAQQIEDMMAGDQHLAALRRLEEIEGRRPPHVRLAVVRLRLLRDMDRLDEWKAAVIDYRQRFPGNAIVLAESATLLAAEGDAVAAAAEVYRSLAATEPLTVFPQMYDAMGVVARALVASNHFRAARAFLDIQSQLDYDDHELPAMLHSLNASPAFPLLLKQDPAEADCPADAPWKAEFDEAMAPSHRLHAGEAVERLAALAQRVEDSPAVWRELAVVRGYLADEAGSAEAFRRLSRLDIPLEDAVEARAAAMLLEDDPLGDQVDALWVSLPIEDVDHLAAVFSTWKQAIVTTRENVAVGEDDVPPKAVFTLLDRPIPETPEQLSVETVSSMVGRAMLFGRQTDRPARLEVTGTPGVTAEAIRAMLPEAARDQLTGDPEQEILGRRSASRCLFEGGWRLPRGVKREDLKAVFKAYLDGVVLETWPRMPLGLFDGKTPEQVAGDPAQRIPLLAAIMVLDTWLAQTGRSFDFNRLRAKLGLPALEPIELGDGAVSDVPLVRLTRVKLDGLSDEALREGLGIAAIHGHVEAMRHFGPCWIDRPGIDPRDLHNALGALAQSAEDDDRRLEYIARGRRAAETLGESSAAWDIMEVETRLARGDVEDAERLLQHIRREHLREPGVAEAFAGILMRLGILRPDGTFAQPAPEQEPAAAPAEPSGLWTPDGAAPSGEKGKLWTPGMD